MQEIFQINQPDLDFGIYRILNSRQEQINEFLQKTLPAKINTAFNGNFEQANSVYNHLYTFFSRYYDQGDFISQRRYKGDTYAIPYAGEEVMLHWANKDQYYTKSGENFSNYAFTLENGKKVQFRLVEADTAKDNRKDNDQDRVFALIEPKIKIEIDENGEEIQNDILPYEENGDLLTLRFEYKAVNKKEKQADYLTQAVEKIQHFAISEGFQGIFNPMPTEKNKNRTLLEKYLTDYTAKNSADYFIHKNLGKFLNQELDFYIKNEVMNLDNIQDSTDFSHIEQNLQTIKTLKTVAKEIIAFLAQLEDFQKKLWLKKKFVAACHYLITLDHLTEAQVQVALNNPKQTAQWQTLFNVETSGLNTEKLCKNYPHLVVDTSLFEAKFQAEVLSNLHDLDQQSNGLLIHSDNFQALNLLQERYKEQVKCIYIDPPYNTDGDGFVYKDSYKHSSWLSLMKDRGELSRKLLKDSGVFFFSIDEIEVAKSWELFNGIYGAENFSTDFVWQKKKKPSFLHRNIGKLNDYILCYTKNYQNTFPFSVEKTTEGKKTPINNAGNSLTILEFKPNSVRFGISDGTVKAQNMSGGNIITELLDDVIIENGKNKNTLRLKGEWRYSQSKVNELIEAKADFYISQIPFRPNHIKDGGEIKKMKNLFSPEHYEMETNEDATAQHSNLFANELFKNPKPEKLINYLIKSVTYDNEKNLILDYFAGSGTTAHAVINLNRADKGNRKYILVEQGEYFDSVLKPRVQKVIFAKEWKDGKPQSDNGAFGGVSQIVKVLKLESYEDTLNNLALKQPASDLFAQNEALQNDYLLHYMLDVESRESLLNTQHFAKPFDYQLNIATTSAGAYEAQTIDLVETFNYLIGLRVSEIDDQREKRGWVTVKGKLANGDNALIIWRDCEKVGYEELNDFIQKNSYGIEDKAEYSSETFNVVYINGDHNVPTVFADSDESIKTLKVRSIEAEFLSRMFGE